ncbi:hypothetical protein [Caulobacter sp. 602-1]|uniref:hypothetical protein n=1 Tax=Caulobacter sp. 602-1 TaxID=2492472 RepID=UPI001315A006|nr:hypothetical protein [Caulobacter sp. 602-1]
MDQMINGQVVPMTAEEIAEFEASRAVAQLVALDMIKNALAAMPDAQRDELISFAASLA